ncbi:MAG: M14 family metallopeptidase [Candidatus Paceibacterota bacterium]
MSPSVLRYVLIAILIAAAVGVALFILGVFSGGPASSLDQGYPATSTDPAVATTTAVVDHEVVGTSVEGRQIQAFTYGSGPTHLLFVGGIHGGYEWNSVLLAYNMMDYLQANPDEIPANITVTIIPSANPDGLYDVIGKEGRFMAVEVPADLVYDGTGRFNANGVDLNRNFDCNWAPESSWRGQMVSAGSGVFSEPEARAIRDFVQEQTITAAVFWHSQANTVYGSECNSGVLPATMEVMNTYARAAGYNAVASFDAYPITGDVEGWLASIGIPAVTVELETRNSIEWSRNLAGVKALFDHYSQ